MPIFIADGSKEEVVVRVVDATEQITNLATLSPTYDLVRDTTDTSAISGSATATGMNVYALLDTTDADVVAGEKYRLYVGFTIAAGNVPRLFVDDVFIIE